MTNEECLVESKLKDIPVMRNGYIYWEGDQYQVDLFQLYLYDCNTFFTTEQHVRYSILVKKFCEILNRDIDYMIEKDFWEEIEEFFEDQAC